MCLPGGEYGLSKLLRAFNTLGGDNVYALSCGQSALVQAFHALDGGNNGLPELIQDSYAIGGGQHGFHKLL